MRRDANTYQPIRATLRTSGFGLALLVVLALPASAGPDALLHLLTRTNQPALVLTTNGGVEYIQFIQSTNLSVPARLHQVINFNEALRTLIGGSAGVRFFDWSGLRLKDKSLLAIVRDSADTNSPAIRLLDGQFYFSSRGGPIKIPVETPHGRGLTKGTEFLVRVDAQNRRTEFTVFEGQVQLSNDVDTKTVHSREQGIAVPGQPIRILPVIQAQNVVQWWIYYPGVLDPEELGLTLAERGQLASSLTAYRSGALPEALNLYPGYPSPPEPDSEDRRIYYAGLLLSVGAVDRAEAQLSQVNSNAPLARALRTMIDAVAPPLSPVAAEVRRLTTPPSQSEIQNPNSSSELLALSYAHQATNNLKAALAAARNAVARSTNFAFGWARVAELEFSFGQTHAARVAVEHALALGPSNAQAHAVKGFLLAAENRIHDAIASFDTAIALDPALGNAWLGRGLCKIRLTPDFFSLPSKPETRNPKPDSRNPKPETRNSELETSALADLSTAAALEPSRSLLRSYLGKAFADAGLSEQALKELAVAKHFDTNDPTPWLYSALLNRELNRINPAIRDLETSIDLNTNRAVYRSRFLLDEDLAVRSSSLANLYQSAGMNEVAVREAARAVNSDYANYSGHLFLSESYNALRDPTRFNLRYETVWFNELLLANLLSPVGGTPLSQHISQQEYSRLFEHNRIGLSTDTSYRSDGQYRELASQFGVLGNTAWSIDLDYQYNDGVRPNNKLDRLEVYGTVKQQLTPQDSVLLLAKVQQYHSGDNFQYYDQASFRKDFYYNEYQSPGALIGAYHREWAPGVHTMLLGGRLANDQRLGDQNVTNYLTIRSNNTVLRLAGVPMDVTYRSEFETWSGELNQIFQGELHSLVLGGRYQTGTFKTRNELLLSASAVSNANFFLDPPAAGGVAADMERISGYAYWTWEALPSLWLTPGVAYDWLQYPEHLRHPPVQAGEEKTDQVSPKAALVWSPLREVTLRGAYTRSLGGVSFDESYRLEPTQLAGFSQGFRTLIPESLAGSVSAPQFETAGLGLDLSFKTRTYVTLEGQLLNSEVRRTVGAFEFAPPPFLFVPSSLQENLSYRERSFSITLNQLVADEWSFGLRYQFVHSELERDLPEVPTAVFGGARRLDAGDLHKAGLFALYNHPSGWFAGADLSWYLQNSSFRTNHNNSTVTTPVPGEEFPQLNLLVGYRFKGQRGEIAIGGLNLTGEDYHLNPVTPYNELPRERVFYVRLRCRF